MSTALEALQAEFDELQALVHAVKEEVAPLREEREAIVQRQQALQVEIDHYTDQMQAVYEKRGYLELSRKFGSVAAALGELKRAG